MFGITPPVVLLADVDEFVVTFVFVKPNDGELRLLAVVDTAVVPLPPTEPAPLPLTPPETTLVTLLETVLKH